METNELPSVSQSTLPQKSISNMRLTRFGSIFHHIAMTSTIVLLCALLGMLLVPIMQLFAIIILFTIIVCSVIFSIGMVFAIESNPVGKMWDILSNVVNSGDLVGNIVVFLSSCTPYICFAGIIFSILSIVFNAISSPTKKVSKIVLASIVIAILLIITIIHYLTGGIVWLS